jgi:hypothetical protein
MAQEFRDDVGIFNACDYPRRTTTHRAHFNIDAEHAFQALRPSS